MYGDRGTVEIRAGVSSRRSCKRKTRWEALSEVKQLGYDWGGGGGGGGGGARSMPNLVELTFHRYSAQ